MDIKVEDLTALITTFKTYRDAPMTKGNRIEVTTIRKTLNVVVTKLEALITSKAKDEPVTKLTPEQKEFVSECLGEGFHTAFRKGTDHPNAHKIWKLIHELPDEEWASVIDFVMSGL